MGSLCSNAVRKLTSFGLQIRSRRSARQRQATRRNGRQHFVETLEQRALLSVSLRGHEVRGSRRRRCARCRGSGDGGSDRLPGRRRRPRAGRRRAVSGDRRGRRVRLHATTGRQLRRPRDRAGQLSPDVPGDHVQPAVHCEPVLRDGQDRRTQSRSRGPCSTNSIRPYPTPLYQGLAFDGSSLYFLADSSSDILYRINPDTGWQPA